MSIFLFKTHPINVTNLAQTLFFKNIAHVSYHACEYAIQENKFITHEKFGDLCSSINPNPNNWRELDWSGVLDKLEFQLDIASSQNKIIMFGSHRDDQISLLKRHFGQRITTIGINYNQDMYPLLLRNVAEHHVWLNCTTEPADYYIQEFDKINLVSRSSITNCDYNILVNDFFDAGLMSKHYENLGFPFTAISQEMYDAWHSNW
jgi:hypothetical protein